MFQVYLFFLLKPAEVFFLECSSLKELEHLRVIISNYPIRAKFGCQTQIRMLFLITTLFQDSDQNYDLVAAVHGFRSRSVSNQDAVAGF